jgi:uncharacterized protein (TIGR00269 family)
MPKCTLCYKNDAIFMRHYSGERLCEKCFKGSIEDKVRITIAKYKMFDQDDKIAVAVSGGKDSISLLYILADIEKKFPRTSIFAITVDEGIKGYRDEALRFAAKSCRELGIKHKIVSFKEMYRITLDELADVIRGKEKNELSPCSYCGVLRRCALNTATRQIGANKLATAHNLDDETQTILLNIIHGDVTRIARVKPVLDRGHSKLIQRVKPFCEVPEREIALYAYLKKIEFQSIPCPYSETAMRNDMRNMLNMMEEKHAGTKFAIFRSIERIRPALEIAAKKEKIRDCKLCGEPTVSEVCQPCQMLQKLHII